ncbi:nucleotidyltransferase [Neobacillus mesonae]|nr:nucleotidyltransferase [Neobacillus mesonae]
MHNANGRFNTFYNDHVVLSAQEQANLRDKKDKNLERLESGLLEYNTDHKKTYKLIDNKVQGSMAMSTIVQNERGEYDIDVAIIFDKDNLPEGTQATKNMIVDALKRKTKTFRTEPEALTNAVRIEYASGYHIDFAIYRKSKDNSDNDIYEHCGREWRSRDPEAITQWFKKKNETSNNDSIRKTIRLLKMYCKSRSGWSMPGGLILSVLVEECIQIKDRIDKTFYYTIKEIRDRLESNKEVYNPTDTSTSLLLNAKDHQKVKNLHTRLTNYIKKLDVLFDPNCTNDKAYAAWKDFFNHSYWGEIISETAQYQAILAKSYGYNSLEIKAEVEWNPGEMNQLSDLSQPLPKGKTVNFTAVPNFNHYASIRWEVKNGGDEAIEENNISFIHNGVTFSPVTKYRGIHRVKCSVYNSMGGEICNNSVLVRVK